MNRILGQQVNQYITKILGSGLTEFMAEEKLVDK